GAEGAGRTRQGGRRRRPSTALRADAGTGGHGHAIARRHACAGNARLGDAGDPEHARAHGATDATQRARRGGTTMKTSLIVAVVVAALLGLMGSAFVVREDQTALVLNLGRVVRADL